MEAIKFHLSGKTAMFKKPDVNSFAYFTYTNIHKIALIGLLGALIGLEGYNQQSINGKTSNQDVEYPEFYRRLCDLKISILPPIEKEGYISKKIHVFNNSVGYASQETGGNLIVREQWLENPEWDIYILKDNSIETQLLHKLQEYILNSKCDYIPYLGKNDHPAVISDCTIIDLKKSSKKYINSLFPKKNLSLDYDTYNDNPTFVFKEVMPYKLNKEYNFYEYEEFMMTNRELRNLECLDDIYEDEGKPLAFF